MSFLNRLKLGNSPIRKNILANMFGIGVNLLNQIALVPFFLTLWGKNLYSDWIVITATSLFFTLTDIGFNSVVQNRFVIAYTKKNFNECNSLLICNFLVISSVFLVSILFAVLFCWQFDIASVLHLSVVNTSTASIVFILLLGQVFVNMYTGIPNSIFRALHKNHQGVLIDQFGRLGVFIITLLALILELDIVILAILINLPCIVVLVIKCIITSKYFHIKLCSHVDWKLFKAVFLQGLGYLSFPVANAIILQGFTLVVNRYFGADSVVLYNTTRTMCNFVKTMLNTVLNSVWPEFSIAYGNLDSARMRDLYKKAISVSIIGGGIISIFILIFGPWIYNFWTHGEVTFSYPLIIAFIVVLMFNTLWNTGCVAMLSTNNHIELGIYNIILTISSLVLAIILAHITHSLPCVVYSSLLIDIILSFFVHKKFNSILEKVKNKIVAN